MKIINTADRNKKRKDKASLVYVCLYTFVNEWASLLACVSVLFATKHIIRLVIKMNTLEKLFRIG